MKTNISHMRKQMHTKLISAIVFATGIVKFLYFIYPKFPVYVCLLCLYSSVCVEPIYWFSHDTAHFKVGCFSGTSTGSGANESDLGMYTFHFLSHILGNTVILVITWPVSVDQPYHVIYRYFFI